MKGSTIKPKGDDLLDDKRLYTATERLVQIGAREGPCVNFVWYVRV